MDYKIVVDTDTLDKFSSEITEESKKLNDLLRDMIDMSLYMEEFFDTPTGKKMKEALIEYLKKSQIKCKEFENYGEKIKKISVKYSNVIDEINKRIMEDGK